MWMVIFQRISLEFIGDFLLFPAWWYTGGAAGALRWCAARWKDGNATLAPGVWLANLFVPMYGQYDWQGRLVSFFVRLVNVFGRSAALFAWSASLFACFLLWILAPVIIVFLLFKSFGL